jgi:hypothetical protein
MLLDELTIVRRLISRYTYIFQSAQLDCTPWVRQIGLEPLARVFGFE